MRPLSLLAALWVLLLNSCYPPGDGKPPPLEELYFPTGLALDTATTSEDPDYAGAPKFMYVANSDFDLQYRAASVISYDLDRVRNVIPRNCITSDDCLVGSICDTPGGEGVVEDEARGASYFCVDEKEPIPCGDFGQRDPADVVLNPGRCQSINPINPEDKSPSLLVSAVGIGAFATDVIWRKNPNEGAESPGRLFVPVRGDSTLHWIDVNKDGTFECGQEGSEDGGCDETHRSGDVPEDNLDELKQPSEPYAVDASADGNYVVLTNQTSGTVSLFANNWAPNAGPELSSILGGLPLAPVGVAALPTVLDGNNKPLPPGFLVTYRTAAQIDLLRVRDEGVDIGPPNQETGSAIPYNRYALRRAGTAPITANSLGFDSRGIAIDDIPRQEDLAVCRGAAEQCSAAPNADPSQCQAELADCLRGARRPAVYVASRAPASLLVGALAADTGSGLSDLPAFSDSVSLTFGPSRVILGYVKVPGNTGHDSQGPYALERRVFAVCFDSRRIFVYDPKRRLIEAIVNTGRGPYAMSVDGVRGLAYLAHFTDSYLGVISLDQRFPKTYAAIVASIGEPKAPRSSK